MHDCDAYTNENIDESFAQMGYLAGIFDSSSGAKIGKVSMGEHSLDMQT